MEGLRQNGYCTRKAVSAQSRACGPLDERHFDEIMIDRRLLDILCDPVTKSPVRLLSPAELEAFNRAIASGELRTEGGATVGDPASAGLITRDGRTIYRILDDIPVMLADESVATARIEDFPRA
jgi:uncharacterized protein YbaR (Trm112 family)